MPLRSMQPTLTVHYGIVCRRRNFPSLTFLVPILHVHILHCHCYTAALCYDSEVSTHLYLSLCTAIQQPQHHGDCIAQDHCIVCVASNLPESRREIEEEVRGNARGNEPHEQRRQRKLAHFPSKRCDTRGYHAMNEVNGDVMRTKPSFSTPRRLPRC